MLSSSTTLTESVDDMLQPGTILMGTTAGPRSGRELVREMYAYTSLVGGLAWPTPDDCLVAGSLQLWPARFAAHLEGQPLALTRQEFRLLHSLIRRTNQVVARRTLLEEVWGSDYVGDTRTLDVHIFRLRRKLEKEPSRPQVISTIRGVGYLLRTP